MGSERPHQIVIILDLIRVMKNRHMGALGIKAPIGVDSNADLETIEVGVKSRAFQTSSTFFFLLNSSNLTTTVHLTSRSGTPDHHIGTLHKVLSSDVLMCSFLLAVGTGTCLDVISECCPFINPHAPGTAVTALNPQASEPPGA
eukprot:Em0003g942a